MSRITERFELLRHDGRKGFIPFVTAGDPDLGTSLAIARKLAALGADIIELGVPFSDPMADGPTIQRSSQRALEKGTTLSQVIDLAAAFREGSEVPLVLFSYFNPILHLGIEEFAGRAAQAGIDGVLLTDVIEDEAEQISERLAASGLDLISLVAPTTSSVRLRHICEHARGFLYAVSRAGVTGARDVMTSDAETLVTRIRGFTDMPVAVGFGISSGDQISDVWRYADAAVVGSAIVSVIEQNVEDPVTAVDGLVRRLLPQFANQAAEI